MKTAKKEALSQKKDGEKNPTTSSTSEVCIPSMSGIDGDGMVFRKVKDVQIRFEKTKKKTEFLLKRSQMDEDWHLTKVKKAFFRKIK